MKKAECFRVKPALAWAKRLTPENREQVAKWLGNPENCNLTPDECLQTPPDVLPALLRVFVRRDISPVGIALAFEGDWIVRHAGGRLAVYSDKDFRATYEEADK